MIAPSMMEPRTALAAAPGHDRPLTVVHIVAPAPFGGLERVVRTLAAGQIEAGHRVHVLAVLSPDPAEHPFVASLRGAGVPVEALEVPGRAYLAERRRIADFCRRVGADVVHTHGYRPDVVDSPVATALGIPRVSTVHGFTGGDWKNRLYERLQRRAFRRFDAVVAVARPQVPQLVRAGVAAGRIHLLPNAWQEGATPGARAARAELGVPDGAFHVGWVGRLSGEKAPDLLLHAMARLSDLPLVVSVVGDGAEGPGLRELAARLGIQDRVRWHGALPDAGRFFPAFDAFVLSSRTEGTPIVLFEAMGARTPIVAAAVGGVPDVVSHAEGILTPAGDVAAIAAGVRSVYADPAGAAARAERGRRRLDADFAMPAWIARHESIYRRVVRPAAP